MLRESEGLLKEVSKVFQGSFKGFSRVFHESFIDDEVLRMFRGRFMIFMGVCRVFKKSFKLYGTHRSFPSRRRACFFYENREKSVICHTQKTV